MRRVIGMRWCFFVFGACKSLRATSAEAASRPMLIFFTYEQWGRAPRISSKLQMEDMQDPIQRLLILQTLLGGYDHITPIVRVLIVRLSFPLLVNEFSKTDTGRFSTPPDHRNRLRVSVTDADDKIFDVISRTNSRK